MKVLSNKSKNTVTFKGKVIPPAGILLLNDDGSVIESLTKPAVEEAKKYTDESISMLQSETKKGAISTVEEAKKYADEAVKNLEDETKKYTDNAVSKQQSETKKGALSTIEEAKKYTDETAKKLEAKIPTFTIDEKEKKLRIVTK